jgi:hypothetical protein
VSKENIKMRSELQVVKFAHVGTNLKMLPGVQVVPMVGG